MHRLTPELLQAFAVQPLEELREGAGITKPPGAEDLWMAADASDEAGGVEDETLPGADVTRAS